MPKIRWNNGIRHSASPESVIRELKNAGFDETTSEKMTGAASSSSRAGPPCAEPLDVIEF